MIKKRIVPEGGDSHGSSAEGGGKERTIEYQSAQHVKSAQ
jgi:hypothetical protein